jgi:hypothetical protein
MTGDQIALFALFGVLFAFLIWGRIRYDLVAFTALLIAVFAGYVAPYDAFDRLRSSSRRDHRAGAYRLARPGKFRRGRIDRPLHRRP